MDEFGDQHYTFGKEKGGGKGNVRSFGNENGDVRNFDEFGSQHYTFGR
jgi:hypothetical protein